MIDLRTYYAGYRLRLIKLEQEWLEIRARHWIKGDHGYFAGSYSTGGGAGAKKAVDKDGKSGIIKSGAISGALSPDSKEAQKHAEQYYESVRKMKTDVSKIAKNTEFSEEDILQIKNHVFIEEHDLGGDVTERFYPSYAMAQSWQRLIDGKNIQKHDLTLLKHEKMESDLMRDGYSQGAAHHITEKKYNYAKESREYYAKTSKHRKKQG